METEHKKIRIEYDEEKNKWVADFGDGLTKEADSLAGIKKKIDNHLRARPLNIPILIYEDFDNKMITGKITSINPDEKDVWISDAKKNRQKVNGSWGRGLPILDTKENRKIIAELIVMRKKIKGLENDFEKKKKEFKRYTFKKTKKEGDE